MTSEEIIELARAQGLPETETEGVFRVNADDIGRLLAAEREACAVICDQRKIITPEWQMDQHYNQAASHCAQAIRLRGRT